ncbi:MAG TPA: hypothetical protein VHB21_18015, partial [Minicystis sp.]|nr:hypothetical protein [Minicystis sp.]
MQLAQRSKLELPSIDGAHDPPLGRTARDGILPPDSELMPAVGALDGRASLGHEGVVELVRGAAAFASDIHGAIRLRRWGPGRSLAPGRDE